MKVEVTKSFAKDLKPLPAKIQNKVFDVIAILQDADSLSNSKLDIVKCKGGKTNTYYRIRIGNYRIGSSCNSNKIILICCIVRG